MISSRPLVLFVTALASATVIAAEDAAPDSNWDKTQAAVERAAQATVTGIERGAKAAGHGITVGINAAERGIRRAAEATADALEKVARKVGGAAGD